MSQLEELVAELDAYLPASVQNQALVKEAPTGDGTLAGFHAKIAEVFRLGESVGWDKGRSWNDDQP